MVNFWETLTIFLSQLEKVPTYLQRFKPHQMSQSPSFTLNDYHSLSSSFPDELCPTPSIKFFYRLAFLGP